MDQGPMPRSLRVCMVRWWERVTFDFGRGFIQLSAACAWIVGALWGAGTCPEKLTMHISIGLPRKEEPSAVVGMAQI